MIFKTLRVCEFKSKNDRFQRNSQDNVESLLNFAVWKNLIPFTSINAFQKKKKVILFFKSSYCYVESYRVFFQ